MPDYVLGLQCDPDDQADKRSDRGKYVAGNGVKYDLIHYVPDSSPTQIEELVRTLHRVSSIKCHVRPIVAIPAAELSADELALRRGMMADVERSGDYTLARLAHHCRDLPAPPGADKAQPQRRPRHRRRTKVTDRPLTPFEGQVVAAVALCHGNVSAAARELGCDRKTVTRSWQNACQKQGTQPQTVHPRVHRLPTGPRGETLLDEDAGLGRG